MALIWLSDGPLRGKVVEHDGSPIFEGPDLLPITKKMPDPTPGRAHGLLGDFPVYRKLKDRTQGDLAVYTCINADNWPVDLDTFLAESQPKIEEATPEQIAFMETFKQIVRNEL